MKKFKVAFILVSIFAISSCSNNPQKTEVKLSPTEKAKQFLKGKQNVWKWYYLDWTNAYYLDWTNVLTMSWANAKFMNISREWKYLLSNWFLYYYWKTIEWYDPTWTVFMWEWLFEKSWSLYSEWVKIDAAPNEFKIFIKPDWLKYSIAKDLKNIYYRNDNSRKPFLKTDADLSTFRLIDWYYWKDKDGIFSMKWQMIRIQDADYESFVVLWNWKARDKNWEFEFWKRVKSLKQISPKS